jgi:hypothetical protein
MKTTKPQYTTLKIISAIILAWLCAIPARSAVIFQDDFSRANSNDPGPQWLSLERDDNDIAIYNERLRLRDYQTTGMTHAQFYLDTSGYENISLSLDWRVLSSTEASDSLSISSDILAHAQGDSIFTTGLGNPGVYNNTFSITDNFVGWIGFWLDVNSASETVYIDNVLVMGDPSALQDATPPFAVSEASSIALIGIGLAGIGIARRKAKVS